MVGPRQARTDDGRSRRRRDDGAAAVEFALVLPIFVALLFGVISYGWMLSYRQGISQAAAEGARAMAVSVSPTGSTVPADRARAAINRSLASYGVTCTSAGTLTRNGATVGTCGVTTTACTTGSTVQCARIAISHNYRANPLIPSFPGLGITLPTTIGYTTTSEVSS
ncbi:MAG: pilus assembly protein [Actinomycetales bacterium]|nr:MAG: pilus assembly protein [Actinomycetales bacterium]